MMDADSIVGDYASRHWLFSAVPLRFRLRPGQHV